MGHRARVRAIHATDSGPAMPGYRSKRPFNRYIIASWLISGREGSNTVIGKDRVGPDRVDSSSDRVVLTFTLILEGFRDKSGQNLSKAWKKSEKPLNCQFLSVFHEMRPFDEEWLQTNIIDSGSIITAGAFIYWPWSFIYWPWTLHILVLPYPCRDPP